ncbi:hypothetical protein [Undibacterium baiyunense]|uniref:Uncharacterized protein n=1 Tax=Undibacterium baiyunense TaxID=2828731 RepID=A0A941DBN4_9BURK|nr:hypothetical protein [Undibacterium baiyunense]MBR7745285.1 hypothetical protein [Undibacterium baiyunense]
MINEVIAAAVVTTRVSAKLLSSHEREGVVDCLCERLRVDVSSHSPWDKFDAPDGVLNHDGWKLIPSFVGGESCLLMTTSASAVWRLGSGKDLMLILQECPPFEFYVCDIAFNYLVCFNHHDYLVGWGDANLWVNHFAQE